MSIEMASFLRAFAYLGGGFVIMMFVLQWMWAKTCDKNIQLLIAQQGGGGKYVLAPKEGGSVMITNPITEETRAWPINELATIETSYPGLGFIPKFMQKSIRLAVVSEGDWEPLLNRSPHRKKVASPDVVAFIQDLSDSLSDQKKKDLIDEFLSDISTSPTREMIADPSMLGNLMRSSVFKALATLTNDLTEALKDATAQLARVKGANPTVVYLGLGLMLVLLIFVAFKMIPFVTETTDKIDLIMKSLGIAVPVP